MLKTSICLNFIDALSAAQCYSLTCWRMSSVVFVQRQEQEIVTSFITLIVILQEAAVR